MRMLEGLPRDEIFCHTDNDGVKRNFNASAIMRAILRRKLTPDFAQVDLYPEIIKTIEQNHGVDQAHLARLTDEQLSQPALVAEFNTGQNLVIDGNHRLVARFRKGLVTAEILIVKEAQWTPFLVTDLETIYSLSELAEFANSARI